MATSSGCNDVAVIDVDGTLIAGNIGVTFVRHLLKRRAIRPLPLVAVAVAYLGYKSKLFDFSWAIRAGAWAMAGQSEADIRASARECFSANIQPNIFGDAEREIALLRQAGVVTVLATGAHESIASELARHLGVELLVATRNVIRDGKYTMRICKPLPFAAGKRDLVLEIVRDLCPTGDIIVYTDEKKDLPLLTIATKCVGVNSDAVVTEYVLSRGGRVVEYR